MPYVVPDVLDAPGQPVSTASFWGDSAVVLPWEIYMASDNHWLLTDVLRREWGFQGMVVTDWGALCNRVKAMHAGCDLSMPGGSNYMEDWVEAVVQDGSLPESDVDACAARVIALVLKSQTRPKGKPFDREAHHALARRVAESGAVLLKNEDGILPLQAEDVVLIGEMARTMRYQGSGSSHINPTRLISLCEAWPQAPFVPGYDTKGNVTEESLAQAAAAAKSAKVAVVCAGLPDLYESEGFDRETMAMPEGHVRLIETVATANPNTVVVLFCGSAVETPWIDRVKAVLYGHDAIQMSCAAGNMIGADLPDEGIGPQHGLVGFPQPLGKPGFKTFLKQTAHIAKIGHTKQNTGTIQPVPQQL